MLYFSYIMTIFSLNEKINLEFILEFDSFLSVELNPNCYTDMEGTINTISLVIIGGLLKLFPHLKSFKLWLMGTKF